MLSVCNLELQLRPKLSQLSSSFLDLPSRLWRLIDELWYLIHHETGRCLCTKVLELDLITQSLQLSIQLRFIHIFRNIITPTDTFLDVIPNIH